MNSIFTVPIRSECLDSIGGVPGCVVFHVQFFTWRKKRTWGTVLQYFSNVLQVAIKASGSAVVCGCYVLAAKVV